MATGPEMSSSRPVSMWTRNIKLSVYSPCLALVAGMRWKDGAEIMVHGFLMDIAGWSRRPLCLTPICPYSVYRLCTTKPA
jgi:hypothetical protein